MVRIVEFKKAAAEKLRALFPQVPEWQESLDATVGDQTVDVLVRFRMGQGQETKTLICEIRSRGEPRYLREAITRLRELRAHLPSAYPIVAAPYVSPQSAALVRRNNCGYVDLVGNCYLAFDNVLIQKEGRPNTGLIRRPLKTLFAPRATRVVRALLVERERERVVARSLLLQTFGEGAGEVFGGGALGFAESEDAALGGFPVAGFCALDDGIECLVFGV
jgi:hypothetical protein